MTQTKRRTIDEVKETTADMLRNTALIAEEAERDPLSDTQFIDIEKILKHAAKGKQICNGRKK